MYLRYAFRYRDVQEEVKSKGLFVAVIFDPPFVKVDKD
jgi:hypothetical protein